MPGHEVWVPAIGGAAGPTTHSMSWAYQGGTPFCGHLCTWLSSGGGSELFEFDVPGDFGTVVSCVANLIPGATDGAWDIDLESYYGATGQSCMTHNETELANTYALTNQQFFALSLIPVLSNLAAGDHVGVAITNNDVADDLYVTTVELVYNYA